MGWEDKVENLEHTGKKYEKLKKMQKLWDTMKKPNFLIIGRVEEESWVSGTDQIFNKITDESISKSRNQGKTIQLGIRGEETLASLSMALASFVLSPLLPLPC